MLIASLACGPQPPPGYNVSERLRHPPPASQPAGVTPAPAQPLPHSARAVAWVDDRPISEQRFKELLMAGHGLFVLEQLIALEVVRSAAARTGVEVSPDDVQAEYELALREMARAALPPGHGAPSADMGAQVLETVLEQKNISHDEYRLSVERNAYLRKMVARQEAVSERDIADELQRREGRQAVVRHIALPDLQAVGEVRRQLAAGADFSALAASASTHRLSGSAGGLLPAFTADDSRVPAVLRRAAFQMAPGEVSEALEIDDEYHVVRLERFVEAPARPMDGAQSAAQRRDLLEARVRQAMQRLEQDLFEKADIRIRDPVLQQEFERQTAK